jgi:hypothetical protein
MLPRSFGSQLENLRLRRTLGAAQTTTDVSGGSRQQHELAAIRGCDHGYYVFPNFNDR